MELEVEIEREGFQYRFEEAFTGPLWFMRQGSMLGIQDLGRGAVLGGFRASIFGTGCVIVELFKLHSFEICDVGGCGDGAFPNEFGCLKTREDTIYFEDASIT